MKSLLTLLILFGLLLSSCSTLNTRSSIQKRKYTSGFFIAKNVHKKLARSTKIESSPTRSQEKISIEEVAELPVITKEKPIRYIENQSSQEIKKQRELRSPFEVKKHSSQSNKDAFIEENDARENSIVVQNPDETNQEESSTKNKPEHLGRSITLIVLGGLKLLLAGILIILALYFGSVFLLALAGFHFLTGATLFTIGNVSMFRSIKKVKNNTNSEP